MNFNIFENQIPIETLSDKEKESNKVVNNANNSNDSKYSHNSFDILRNKNNNNNNNNNIYNKKDIIQLTIENDNKNKEIALLKSKIKKFVYELGILKERHQEEISKLSDEYTRLELSYKKIKNEKDKYINNIKLLQINNNKLQNDIGILKSQIENNKNNESKYINQISNLIQEINHIKEQQNQMIYNNNSALTNYQNEINDLNKKIMEKNILEDELNNLLNEEKMQNYGENIDKCLFNSINFINGKIKKILSESVEFQKGKIKKENILYNNIKNLIEEFNEIKNLVNNKENQIRNTNIDKNVLIDYNKKISYENNLLKKHINKLIINIDLYINQNHLATKRIHELESYIKQKLN